VEHDLFPKTGIHFSGSCSNWRMPAYRYAAEMTGKAPDGDFVSPPRAEAVAGQAKGAYIPVNST
jgi:hypothetical protein